MNAFRLPLRSAILTVNGDTIFERACCFSAFPTNSDQYGPIFYWNWFVALLCTTLSATNVRVCDFANFSSEFDLQFYVMPRIDRFITKYWSLTFARTHTHSMLEYRSLRAMSYFFPNHFQCLLLCFCTRWVSQAFCRGHFSIGIRHSLSIKKSNVRKRFFFPTAASHRFV